MIDTNPLRERLEGALREHAFVQHSPGAGEHIDLSPQAAEHFAARIAPLIAAEVRKAQAEAWDEGWGQGMAYVTGMERGTDDELDHAITNPHKASETA